jgi:hypothetical protein
MFYNLISYVDGNNTEYSVKLFLFSCYYFSFAYTETLFFTYLGFGIPTSRDDLSQFPF